MLFEVNIPDDTCIVHCSSMYTERQKKNLIPYFIKAGGGGGWLWILWLPTPFDAQYIHSHFKDTRSWQAPLRYAN